MELKLCLSIKEINQNNLIKQSLSMNNIITELSRPVRRRLKKVVQFNKDGNYRRRAEAILLLHQCYSRKQVSQLLNASRTSIRKWVQRFEQFGESALFPENRGRTPYSINETISTRLLELFQKQPKILQEDLFRMRLENMLDINHELIKLSKHIDRESPDKEWGALFVSTKGAPAIRTRLIAGLHYLKHLHDLSDEQVVKGWTENPYWQYFCGEEYFQHKMPIHPVTMTKWRNRPGKSGSEKLLIETIKAGLKSKTIKPGSLKKVTVDTTVQEKNIAFPINSKLLNKARENLVKLSKEHGIKLRQNYNRVGPQYVLMASRYAHAKQFKRMKKMNNKLKSRLGRVKRNIERQLPNYSVDIQSLFEVALKQAQKLIEQEQHTLTRFQDLDNGFFICRTLFSVPVSCSLISLFKKLRIFCNICTEFFGVRTHTTPPQCTGQVQPDIFFREFS